MKKIFWIASYPKSGNTWLRSIIVSIFFSKNGEFKFDLMKNIHLFENKFRYLFVKEKSIIDFENLKKLNTISKYYIEAQNISNVGGDFAFFKTHSSLIKTYGNRYTNNNNTLGLIYIVRDPRDVVVSYSNFLNYSIDKTIEYMKKRRAIDTSGDSYPVLQSRWDYNCNSWKKLNVPKLFIKYEDLLEDTAGKINEIIDFFKINYNFKFNNTNQLINNIITTTSFKKLKDYEKDHGFYKSTNSFFRKGTSKQWKSVLSNSQIRNIENSFRSTMRDFKYL